MLAGAEVISEEVGMKLESVELTSLGSARKVLAPCFPARNLAQHALVSRVRCWPACCWRGCRD